MAKTTRSFQQAGRLSTTNNKKINSNIISPLSENKTEEDFFMKKIIALIAVLALLSGCSVSINDTADTTGKNTNSNITADTTIPETVTEIPPADPVAGLESLSPNKVVWGFGKVENHQKPEEPKGLNEKYKSLSASWFVNGGKSICLTFDEGYENGYTPAILDTLKEKNVKAIFFVA